MCHAFISDPRFYQLLTQLDQQTADEVQAQKCAHCGGVLHVSNYPRKPKGIRTALDESYERRFSFCCAREGCRRRTTPPSIRFLGRKVYLGSFIVLITALQHGLSNRRRKQLIEELDLWPQTISHWRKWWRETFSNSRLWKAEQGSFIPPIATTSLPGDLLGRLTGSDLSHRLRQLLYLLAPLTTASWSGSLMGAGDPQTI